jgi:hypothetical protein
VCDRTNNRSGRKTGKASPGQKPSPPREARSRRQLSPLTFRRFATIAPPIPLRACVGHIGAQPCEVTRSRFPFGVGARQVRAQLGQLGPVSLALDSEAQLGQLVTWSGIRKAL